MCRITGYKNRKNSSVSRLRPSVALFFLSLRRSKPWEAYRMSFRITFLWLSPTTCVRPADSASSYPKVPSHCSKKGFESYCEGDGMESHIVVSSRARVEWFCGGWGMLGRKKVINKRYESKRWKMKERHFLINMLDITSCEWSACWSRGPWSSYEMGSFLHIDRSVAYCHCEDMGALTTELGVYCGLQASH